MTNKFTNKLIVIGLILIGVIVTMSILAFGILSAYREINEEKRFDMKEMNEIQVEMSSAPIHIIRTEASNEVKVHYYGKAKQEIKLAAEVNNKTVIIGAKRKHEALPIPEDMVLDIFIPEEYGKDISVKTSSGIVTMDSFDLENFTLNTSSGGLEMGKLKVQKFSLHTSSSKININKLDTKELEIKGSSTTINVEECIAKDARVEISSGSISLKNSCGNFKFKGTAGNVRIAFRTFDNQNLGIGTTAGKVTVELPSTAEFLLEAKTVTGKFKSDFPINFGENTDKRKIEGKIGSKNNKILLQTSTGDITLLKCME